MERIDIDRCIAAKFAFEEAMNAAFHGSHSRLTETSISLPTTNELRAVSEAVGILPEGFMEDEDGNPTLRRVVYGGCMFWCPADDVEVGAWTTSD